MRQTTKSLGDVQAAILSAIDKCLPDSGSHVTLESSPVDDIEEFDSLCAIEVLVELGDELGIELEDELFLKVRPKSRKHLTIAEVSQIVYDQLTAEQQEGLDG